MTTKPRIITPKGVDVGKPQPIKSTAERQAEQRKKAGGGKDTSGISSTTAVTHKKQAEVVEQLKRSSSKKSSSSSTPSPSNVTTPVQQYIPAPLELAQIHSQELQLDQALKQLRIGEEQSMRQQMIGGTESISVSPMDSARVLESIRSSERKEAVDAMNLGPIEGPVGRYEAYVSSTLEPLTTSGSKMGRFAGGVAEGIAYTPSAIPRLVAGLVSSPSATVRETFLGTSEQIIKDPSRGTGQLLGAVVGGKVLGSIPKIKTPAIRLKTTPQDILIKTELPIMEPTTVPKPPTFGSIGSSMDIVPLQRFPSRNVKIPSVEESIRVPKTNEPRTLIGKQKDGYAEVYIKATPEEALPITESFLAAEESFRSVNVGGKSYLVFEPVAPKPGVQIKSFGDFTRLPKPDVTLIGDMSKPKFTPKSPFRIERRLNLEPAELTKIDTVGRLQLQEFTFVKGEGGVVPEPLQLMTTKPAATESFFRSETAQLGPMGKVLPRKTTFAEPAQPFLKAIPLSKAKTPSIISSKNLQAIFEAEARAKGKGIPKYGSSESMGRIGVSPTEYAKIKSKPYARHGAFAGILPIGSIAPMDSMAPRAEPISTPIGSMNIPSMELPTVGSISPTTVSKTSTLPATAPAPVPFVYPGMSPAPKGVKAIPAIGIGKMPVLLEKKKKSPTAARRKTKIKTFDWKIVNPIGSIFQ